MTNTLPQVLKELQHVLESTFRGISISFLPSRYQSQFYKKLDYQAAGVNDIQELLDKMGDMVHYYKARETKETRVISARIAKIRRSVYLKPEVTKLLKMHPGGIKFSSFEDSYKNLFKRKFNYDYYGLNDLDDLCQVLDDILVVEVANPSEEKLIKAVKIYNLRKRKGDEEDKKLIKAVKIYNLRKRKEG